MHAYQSTSFDLAYSDEAPVLIAASGEAALDRARTGIAASGRRIGACLDIHGAGARLEMQARTGVLWVEIDRDEGVALDDLLEQVNRDVADGRYPAVISAQADCIDAILARTDQAAIELLVDADDAERAASLAIATGLASQPARVSDISSDASAARLRQLSDEVNRIAATLARLSSTQPSAGPVIEPLAHGDVPPVSAERVRAVIRARRLRARFFEELFANPAELVVRSRGRTHTSVSQSKGSGPFRVVAGHRRCNVQKKTGPGAGPEPVFLTVAAF